MSSASPDDLAVTFRSIPRRLREAQHGAAAATTASPTAEVHGLLHDAARLMGTSTEPEAIADAVAHRHASEWDDATLAQLRSIALDLGRLLRHIAALAEAATDAD